MNIVTVTMLVAGGILIYSGFTGNSIRDVITSTLKGETPPINLATQFQGAGGAIGGGAVGGGR